MKRILVLALALAAAAGCASGVKKQFTLTVDPPDAQIMVIARADQPGESYRSPAAITIPEDRAMAAQSRVVICRENYKTTVLPLSSVQGDSIRIKLAKAVQYRLKYSLLTPVRSEHLTFQDRVLAIRLVPREQHIDLEIDNLTKKPLTVLWDSAEYTDAMNRRHRIIHSGIKWENRAARVPPQIIPAGGSLKESVMPESSITRVAGDKKYAAKPLFVLDNDSALSLKGSTVNLFLPVEIDRAIIPSYSFTIRIDDVIKE